MLTLQALLRAMRQKAGYGEIAVAVPRDHAPASYYADRRLRERERAMDDSSHPQDGRAAEACPDAPPTERAG